MFKKIIKVLLCISLLSLSACGMNDKVSLPLYKHYNPDEFYKDIDTILELSKAGDSEKLLNLYDKLYNELLNIYDIQTVCVIEHYKDFTSDYYADELNYINEVGLLCEDEFCSAMHEITLGPCRDELEKHIPVDIFRGYKEYEPLSEEQIELENRETELVTEYNGLDTYADDFYDKAGEIFIELVKIRNQIAELKGYDNYCDYADVEIFDRDYDTKELDSFHKAVKSLYDYEIDLDLYSLASLDFEYDFDGETQIKNLKEIIYGISDLADEAYDYFVKNKLYYLNNEDYNYDCGFTATYEGMGVPFIYYRINKGASDISSMCHEFGHFTNAYLDKNPNPLFVSGCYDLFEIHSNAFDLLASRNYSKLIDDPYNFYEIFNVFSIISGSVMNGCIVDEWERVIYKNPDMSIEQMCELFKDIFNQYNCFDYTEYGLANYWMDIPHVFESPMYYISYATSGFAALQIWQMGLIDYDGAVKVWEDIVKQGAYYTGYMEVVEDAGLVLFSDSDKVEQILSDIVVYCEGSVFE